jgi:hypothetical protein
MIPDGSETGTGRRGAHGALGRGQGEELEERIR